MLDLWRELLRKPALIYVRTTKAQISLRVRAGWSAPLLFAKARFFFLFSTKKRLTNLNGEQNDTGNLLVFHRICHFRAIQPFDLFCCSVVLPPEVCCAWVCVILSVTRLFVHFVCAKARISLRIRAVWFGSSLCALWKAWILYILYAAGEDFYLIVRMHRLILVIACRVLVYCGNCCVPDNLLLLYIAAIFGVTYLAWHTASRNVFVCDVISVYYLLHPEEAVMGKRWC